MKLQFAKTTIETSEAFVEETFGIGDEAVIMELLRSKMYSNPIRTIVQEVCSNARDAHREVGRTTVPFEIKLPTTIDPEFHVRDFGPGITPDRMGSVFIRYGNSTKRGDNIQTGGFGLGAKSPWSYGDSFQIESFTPEDGKIIKRVYVAVIDETRKGKLIKMEEVESTEPQGTRIVIGVKATDIYNFATWVKNKLQYWDYNGEPLPNVVGGNGTFSWDKPEVTFSGEAKGNRWDMTIPNHYANKRGVEAVIDGIPYDIQAESLNNLSDRLRNLFQRHVRLYFKVGEIAVTGNREDVDYSNADTINKLKRRLADVYDSVGDAISKKIETCKNLWDANVSFAEMRTELREFKNAVKWKGMDVLAESFSVKGANVTSFRMSGDKMKATNDASVFPEKDTLLLTNDCGKKTPDRRRVKRIFKETPNVKKVVVVTWRMPEDGTPTQVAKDLADSQATWQKDYNWSSFEAGSLNAFEPWKDARNLIAGMGGKSRPAVRCRKFNASGGSGYINSWPEADGDISELEGVYVTLKERAAYLENGKEISYETLRNVVTHLNIEVYGVMQNFKKHVHDDLEPLDEQLKTTYNDLLVKAKHSVTSKTDLIQNALNSSVADLLKKNKSKLGQELQEWIEVSDKAIEADDAATLARSIAILLDEKFKDTDSQILEKKATAATKAYPLLTSFNLDEYWNRHGYKADKKAVLEYLA